MNVTSIIRPNINANSVSTSRSPVKRKRAGARPKARVPLARNTRLGTRDREYRIDKLIGIGSFSLVYSAIETGTNIGVVIKEYFPKHYARRKTDNEIVALAGRKQSAYCEGVKISITRP